LVVARLHRLNSCFDFADSLSKDFAFGLNPRT
jgi:hypothetical protein